VLKPIFYIAFILSLPILLLSQKQRCASPYNIVDGVLAKERAYTRTNKTIQLVFHILYHSEDENISNEEIMEQIDLVNKDFNAINNDIASVPDVFQELIGNPNLSFILANEDEKGLPFSGIFRQFTPIENIASQFSEDGKEIIKYKVLGGSNAFFPASYVNIWIGRTTDIFGVTAPLDKAGSPDDGIIITPEAFGVIADPDSPTSLGRTLTHELGHYFGLNHLWGLQNGCGNDDGIEDTPIQERPYVGCPEFPQLSCGSFDMHMNFMDFSNDECLLFFTKGQVEIMRQTLEDIRSGTIVSTSELVQTNPDVEFTIKVVSDQLSISTTSNLEGPVSVSIFSIGGQIIHKDLLNELNVHRIDTNEWPRAVYILAIHALDQRFTHTFIAGY